jgi:hypothetical protein
MILRLIRGRTSSVETVDSQYQAAVGHMEFAGSLIWTVFESYMLTNALLLAFELSRPNINGTGWRLGDLGVALLGLSLSATWYAAHSRYSTYYKFRMAQAKEIEPRAWRFLRDRGESLARGCEVTIENQQFRMGILARNLPLEFGGRLVVLAFIGLYAVLAILSTPALKAVGLHIP